MYINLIHPIIVWPSGKNCTCAIGHHRANYCKSLQSMAWHSADFELTRFFEKSNSSLHIADFYIVSPCHRSLCNTISNIMNMILQDLFMFSAAARYFGLRPLVPKLKKLCNNKK